MFSVDFPLYLDNEIGDDGGKALGKALEVNQTLQSLNLKCMWFILL